MLKNYFSIAWRTMVRHKLYTTINVVGLSIGICACLAIWAIAHYELSFDKFHPDRERIYRVVSESRSMSGVMDYWGDVPEPTAEQARKELSGIELIADFHNYDATVTIPGLQGRMKKFPKAGDQNNNDLVFADPQYFQLFRYEWVAGNPATALNNPFQVVLSLDEAKKYFGTADADEVLGRTVVYDDSIRATVSGLVKDLAAPTDFTFKDFISYATIKATGLRNDFREDQWGNFNSSSELFVKLARGVTAERVNKELQAFGDQHVVGFEKQQHYRMLLQPLSNLHYSEQYDKDYGHQANLSTLYGLMSIAVFILLLASINFINLSTAQSLKRSKEIGIRKVLGSRRAALVFQFISETFLLVLIALVLSLALLKPVLAAFSSFTPEGLRVNLLDPAILGCALGVLVFTSVLAGFYPGWVLSSFQPVLILKGQGGATGRKRNWFGKGLVVFQFTISIVFIIAVIIIRNQMHYMLNTDMGFAKNAIIHFDVNEKDSLSVRKRLLNRLRTMEGIDRAAMDWAPPAIRGAWSTTVEHAGPASYSSNIHVRAIDTAYIPLYKLRLLAGRNILSSDTPREVIINATYSSRMGYHRPEDAIGHTIDFWGKPVPIVGVIADFHMRSMKHEIGPLLMTTVMGSATGYSVQLHTQGERLANFQSTIRSIEQCWKEYFPDRPFHYTFLDESIRKFYKAEENTATLVNLTMAITIIISCMGLFGLAALAAGQRTREIGIRKVLGAGVGNIAAMISRDFLLLVLFALILSIPVSWYFMHKWLQDYNYRISISWWIFVLAGLAAVSIALLTVSFHAIRAALANPVKSLHSE